MGYRGMYNDNQEFGGPMQHAPIDPRALEVIKAKSLIKKSDAEDTTQLVNEIESGYYHRNNLEEENKRIIEDLEVVRKKLNIFEKKFGELKKCHKCSDGNIHPQYGSRYKCNICEGTGLLREGTKEEAIYVAIDEAAEGSKENTCIMTFKKHKDGTFEVIDTKILKPKK